MQNVKQLKTFGACESTQDCVRRADQHDTRRMQAYEVMREILKTVPAKQIAAELRVSLSLVYKWAEAPVADGGLSGANSPLERTVFLMRLAENPQIAQWLCAQAGGFFIRNPAQLHCDGPLIPLTNDIVQEFADMLATIAQSSSDNVINVEESRRIRQRWEELKSVTEGFVQACELGNFAAEPAGTATEPKPAPRGRVTREKKAR